MRSSNIGDVADAFLGGGIFSGGDGIFGNARPPGFKMGRPHRAMGDPAVLDLTWDALAHRHYRASRPVKTNRYSARALVFQSEAGSISHRPANARMTSSGFNPVRTTPAASAADSKRPRDATIG